MRSVVPVSNAVRPPVYKGAMHTELVPGAVKPYTDEALRDPITRGFYLATIAHCMECHGRRPDGVQDYKNALGKGGYVFTGPWGAAVTPNITSHPQSGLGPWTDAEIKRGLTHGGAPRGPPVPQPHGPQTHFSPRTPPEPRPNRGRLPTHPPT